MTYTKLVRDQIAMYEGWIKDAKSKDHHARIVEQFIAKFPEGHYHTSITGELTVTYNLKTSAVLVLMLQWLRAVGYRSVKVVDSPEHKSRTFMFVSRGSTMSKYAQERHGEIKFRAHFNDDNATCKYVQVGTEIQPATEAVEVPVYELQCEDLDSLDTYVAVPAEAV